MPDRFPGYDVLAKRQGLSWNDKTREVIGERLALGGEPRFFTLEEFALVGAIAARLVPQPPGRPAVNVAILIDDKLHRGRTDGFRHACMPREQDAWRRGLAALREETAAVHGRPFERLEAAQQDALLTRMQSGDLYHAAWGGMKPDVFFKERLAHDIVRAYYAHPHAWSEVGWGGPASPRGYVRMGFDERDPWEAAEIRNGDEVTARRKNQRVG